MPLKEHQIGIAYKNAICMAKLISTEFGLLLQEPIFCYFLRLLFLLLCRRIRCALIVKILLVNYPRGAAPLQEFCN